MYTYLYLVSSPVGRLFRSLLGAGLIGSAILLDHHGSCVWLLLFPGTFITVIAILDLHLLAPLLGLSPIGDRLRHRFRQYPPMENRLNELTYIGDRLRESSHPPSVAA